MALSIGKFAKRAKELKPRQFLKELDQLVGIKRDSRHRASMDKENSDPLLTGDSHSWADIGEALHMQFMGKHGRGAFKRLKDLRFGGLRGGRWTALEEAGDGAMGPSQFQAINYWSETTAKILEAIQLMKLEDVEFIGDKITTLRPGIVQNVGRRPRYSPPTTQSRPLQPNEPIPMGNIDAEWIDVNPLEKHGQGLAIGTETMLFDGNQGAAVDAIGNIAYQIGWAKEDRILKPAFGIQNTFRYGAADSQGLSTSGNTYQTSIAAPFNYINQSVCALSDEVSLNIMEQLFLALKHPRTGYPINMSGKRMLVVTPYLLLIARRIARMTSVEQGPRTAASQPGPLAVEHTDTTWAGPMVDPIYTQRARDLMQTNFGESGWTALGPLSAGARFIYGDPRRAFEYRESRPFQMWSWNMTQDPGLATRDCFMMVLAIEQGSVTVVEPRHVTLGTNDVSGGAG